MTKPRDFLGQELAVGDLVIYPVLSGRSCQMTLARILKMDVVTDVDEFDSRAELYRSTPHRRAIRRNEKWVEASTPEEIDQWVDDQIASRNLSQGTIRKATVQPVGLSSRWTQHGRWDKDEPVKAVHLSANAKSMVKAPDVPLEIQE